MTSEFYWDKKYKVIWKIIKKTEVNAAVLRVEALENTPNEECPARFEIFAEEFKNEFIPISQLEKDILLNLCFQK